MRKPLSTCSRCLISLGTQSLPANRALALTWAPVVKLQIRCVGGRVLPKGRTLLLLFRAKHGTCTICRHGDGVTVVEHDICRRYSLRCGRFRFHDDGRRSANFLLSREYLNLLLFRLARNRPLSRARQCLLARPASISSTAMAEDVKASSCDLYGVTNRRVGFGCKSSDQLFEHSLPSSISYRNKGVSSKQASAT